MNETLIYQLEQAKDAANAHTINKAISYYKQFCRREPKSATIRFYINKIEQEAQLGLNTGNWKPLHLRLIDFW